MNGTPNPLVYGLIPRSLLSQPVVRFILTLAVFSCWYVWFFVDDYRYRIIYSRRLPYATEGTLSLLQLICIVGGVWVLSLLLHPAGYLHNRKEEQRASLWDNLPYEGVIAVVLVVGGILTGFFASILSGHEYISHLFRSIIWFSVLLTIVLVCCRRLYTGQLAQTSIIMLLYRYRSDLYRLLLLLGAVVLGNIYLLYNIRDEWAQIAFVVVNLCVTVTALLLFVQIGAVRSTIRQVSDGRMEKPEGSPLYVYGGFSQQIKELNQIRGGIREAVQAQLKAERLKTELITNVSHDIKTPLTSIINYVDLLKATDRSDPKVSDYLEVLERKSQRLKGLIDDLMEASKAGSGNVTVHMEEIDAVELMAQVGVDFDEAFSRKRLEHLMRSSDDTMLVRADGRHLSRIVENLYGNAAKYAMPGSRIYTELSRSGGQVLLSVKNISEAPLNISVDELMERFVRGDRSRHTEGSGLGLYIARSLAELMDGELRLAINGDLFEAVVVLQAWR